MGDSLRTDVGNGLCYTVSLSTTGISGQTTSNFQITTNRPVSSTIYIGSLSDLQSMSENWGDSQYPPDGNYVLTNDIDASSTRNWNGGLGFQPMGSGQSDYFQGIFDGQGHQITGLYCNRPNEVYAALFALWRIMR